MLVDLLMWLPGIGGLSDFLVYFMVVPRALAVMTMIMIIVIIIMVMMMVMVMICW